MNTKKIKIAPSILSADFSRLGEQIKEVEAAGADLIHVDVMDGHFVPNISIGIPVVASLRKATDLPLDVHLMIENPDLYIPEFAKAGADYITVHVEACIHLHRTLQLIRQQNVKAGLTMNPATPLSSIDEVWEEIDLLLLMSVNPGFGGQKFIPKVLDKIRKARHILDSNGLTDVELEVDGGVGLENAKTVAEAGASILVSGSAIFHQPSPAEIVQIMRRKIVNTNYV